MIFPQCPDCNGSKVWKDGLRKTRKGKIQRFICRVCGYRFSETSNIGSNKPNYAKNSVRQNSYSSPSLPSNRQICVTETIGAKNLAKTESRTEKQSAGGTKPTEANIKGKIVEYVWWMKKQGYAESTILGYSRILKILAHRGANLYEPESIKETIAKQELWSLGRKENAVKAYTLFLKMLQMKWDPPRYRAVQKLPFIPMEAEIDNLIAGCSKKIAAFLQLLKETAMRCGEAYQLKWVDIDTVNSTVRIEPEKHSNPRIIKISNTLMAMLSNLPRTSERMFNYASKASLRRTFEKQRKRIAHKLSNPRLSRISFHTFRHWKATMEYHRTKDILHVMKLLGHKRIQNTLKYTQLVNFKTDDYICKAATTLKEAHQLIEAGFEYVTDMENVKLFRKPK